MAAPDQAKNGMLRSLNVRQDLYQVADLIDLCFHNAMDEDGHDYVNYLRRMARDTMASNWGIGSMPGQYPTMQGYVYVIGERLIGNLSILPFRKNGNLIYLIANVAVHPDYRRAGIARKLTSKALTFIRSRSAQSAWLQVRDDNPAAQSLYLSMGFEERCRRSTWTLKPISVSQSPLPPGITIRNAGSGDWDDQLALYQDVYPESVRWNLGLQFERLQPSMRAAFRRFFRGISLKNFVVNNRLGKSIGYFVHEKTSLYADNVWVAAYPDHDYEVVSAMKYWILEKMGSRKPFSFNFPAYRSEEMIQSFGFTKNHTLIWMEESAHAPTAN